MNTQSSPIKIFAVLALLVIALVAVYFSLNKTLKIIPENLSQVGTSSTSYSTSTLGLPNNETPKDGKPIIKKLDLPNALNIDQKGTWVIYASSTDGKELTYSAVWGDEVGGVSNPVVVKNNTFTHSYAYAGSYNPVITVYGSNGQSVYASAGIRVLGEITKAPTIYSLSPSSATPGTLITVNGAGFTGPKTIPGGPGTMPSNEVLFDGEGLAGVTSNGVNNLYFLIPDKAKVGKHSVQVKNSNGTSNSVEITVTK